MERGMVHVMGKGNGGMEGEMAGWNEKWWDGMGKRGWWDGG
jgi:hypothetical protein